VERLSFDVFQGYVLDFLFTGVDVEDGDDIRMVKGGRCLRFGQKTKTKVVALSPVRREHLERDESAKADVSRSIHDAHSATAEFLQHFVMADDSSLHVGHSGEPEPVYR